MAGRGGGCLDLRVGSLIWKRERRRWRLNLIPLRWRWISLSASDHHASIMGEANNSQFYSVVYQSPHKIRYTSPNALFLVSNALAHTPQTRTSILHLCLEQSHISESSESHIDRGAAAESDSGRSSRLKVIQARHEIFSFTFSGDPWSLSWKGVWVASIIIVILRIPYECGSAFQNNMFFIYSFGAREWQCLVQRSAESLPVSVFFRSSVHFQSFTELIILLTNQTGSYMKYLQGRL